MRIPCCCQDVTDGEERLRAKGGELEDSQRTVEAATDMLAEAEVRARDLYEENKRLSEHISVGVGSMVLLCWVGCGRGTGG